MCTSAQQFALVIWVITVHTYTQRGKSALHSAAKHGETNVVQMLLKASAKKDLMDKVLHVYL